MKKYFVRTVILFTNIFAIFVNTSVQGRARARALQLIFAEKWAEIRAGGNIYLVIDSVSFGNLTLTYEDLTHEYVNVFYCGRYTIRKLFCRYNQLS